MSREARRRNRRIAAGRRQHGLRVFLVLSEAAGVRN